MKPKIANCAATALPDVASDNTNKNRPSTEGRFLMSIVYLRSDVSLAAT